MGACYKVWVGTLLLLVATLAFISRSHADEPCGTDAGIALSPEGEAPWSVSVAFTPQDVPLNAVFDATVMICSQNEALPTKLTIDAEMPAHKHGMNYKPELMRVAANRYEAKNLLFHMPGEWRLEVTTFNDQQLHRFFHDLEIR